MDAAAEPHAMARALASFTAVRERCLDTRVPLLITAPAPVVRHRYRPPAPPRPPPIRDKIIAFLSEPRPVAAIAMHIERSVPITTGHLGAMRRRGLVKRLGYATYAPGSYDGPPLRLRIRRPATPRTLRQELASLLGQRSSVLALQDVRIAGVRARRVARDVPERFGRRQRYDRLCAGDAGSRAGRIVCVPRNTLHHSHFGPIAFSTMEANMARLILQLGAPVVVPFRAPRKLSRTDLPARTSREAAARAAGLDRLGWVITPKNVQAGLSPRRQNTEPVERRA